MTASDKGAATGLRGSPKPLADTYDVGLLDLDGVVYLGGQPIASAPSALVESRGRGMRFAFVTNNAFRTPHKIAEQLDEFGVTAAAEDVVTSAQAAARLVADRVPRGANVLVVGALGLRQAVREQGLRPVTSARDRPAAVVQGYHPDLSYELLAEGALAVRDGAAFVVSNADSTMPSPRGQVPGNGAMMRVIAVASGTEPVVAGKPEVPLHREAVRRTGARNPLIVGDRLDTDVEGAVRAGTPSLLVLTGVADPVDVITAPPYLRPTYLARDLGGLLDTHPEVHRTGDTWWCRGWRASNRAGRLSLETGAGGTAEPLDGVRALCAAAWGGDGPINRASLTDTLGQYVQVS